MSLIPYIAPAKKKMTKKKKAAYVKKQKAKAVNAVAKANKTNARWGVYAWTVTADKIRTLSDASFTDEWNKDDSKRNPSEAKISFPVYKDLQPTADIANEIRTWRSQVGKTNYLYIGSTPFGCTKKYRLTKVDVSEVTQLRGEIVHCEIELTFTEVKGSKTKKLPKRITKKTSNMKATKKKKQAKKQTKKK